MSVFSKNFKIGNKKIDFNSQTFIVAEAGVNHNGDLKKAFKLVDLAAKQAWMQLNSKHLILKLLQQNLKKLNIKKSFNDKETQYSMLKKLELNSKDFIKSKDIVKKTYFFQHQILKALIF